MGKKRILICYIWVGIAYINSFFLKDAFLSSMLITQYAGHFIIGIVLFELRTTSIKPIHMLLILFSSVLVYNNMIRHQLWIDSFDVHFDHASILLLCFFLISLVWICSHIESLGVYYPVVRFLGAMTYPLYLIHADLGFWSHAIFERKWWGEYAFLKQHVGYYSMVFIAIFLAFLIAYFLVRYLDPIIQNNLKKFWLRINSYKKSSSEL